MDKKYPIDIEEARKLFAEAKANKTHVLLKNAFPNVPTWSQVLNKVNERFHADSGSLAVAQPDKEKVLGQIILRNNFHLQVMDFTPSHDYGKTYEKEYFDGAQDVIEFLNEILPARTAYSFGLVNFVGGERPTENHPDPRDVVSWHCIGNVEWRLYKDLFDENPQIIILEPGDLLYLPEGVNHAIFPSEPRASIIFNYGDK